MCRAFHCWSGHVGVPGLVISFAGNTHSFAATCRDCKPLALVLSLSKTSDILNMQMPGCCYSLYSVEETYRTNQITPLDMNAQRHCIAGRHFLASRLIDKHLIHRSYGIGRRVRARRSDPAAAAASNAAAGVQQVELTEHTLHQYVEDIEELSRLLGGSQGLKVQQLLDGVINMVFRGVVPTPCAACHVWQLGSRIQRCLTITISNEAAALVWHCASNCSGACRPSLSQHS
jgi:hypothetical protein